MIIRRNPPWSPDARAAIAVIVERLGEQGVALAREQALRLCGLPGPQAVRELMSVRDGLQATMLAQGASETAAVALAREGARFVILGALVAELNAEGSTSIAPTEIDSFQFPIKGITLRGYSACEDDPRAFDEWMKRLDEWRNEGAIRLPCTTFSGLENAPKALQEACAGRLQGVVLVEL